MTTGKTIALTRQTFVGEVMSLLLNMLSRLVIIFLSRSKHLLISWLQSPSAVILERPPQKYCCHTKSILLSLWKFVRNQYQQTFENNPPIFSAVWHLPREIFDLAIESFNKIRRLKKHSVIAEKKPFKCEANIKWEINIKGTFKTPCIWKLNVYF